MVKLSAHRAFGPVLGVVRFVRTLRVAIASGLAASAAASAEPPRWVVSDADSTMVLFPTIHILPKKIRWQTDGLVADLEAANDVWFELEPSEMQNQALMQRLSAEYGLSPERPLSERLDRETYQRFAETARGLGLDPARLDPFRPWLAAITLSVTDLVRDGFTPGAGVEAVLSAMVPEDKHRGLETAEEQLGFFAALPPEVEVAFLRQTLEEIGESAGELRALARSWAAGDISELETMMIESIRDVSEELYVKLLVERNRAWADRLERELEGEGQDFVAVGGGHLVGEQGLPQLLAERGYNVTGPGF